MVVAVARRHPSIRHLTACVFTLVAALSPMVALAADPDRDALFLGERLFVHFQAPAERIACPNVGMLSVTEARIVRMCWAVPDEWVHASNIVSWLRRALFEITQEFPALSNWELYDQGGGLILLTDVEFLGRHYSLSVAIDQSRQYFTELRYAPE